MTTAAEQEVDANYEAFEAALPDLLRSNPGQYVLLKGRKIQGFFEDSVRAMRAGRERFQDGLFSIQEVTDRPADLGFFSHAIDTRPA